MSLFSRFKGFIVTPERFNEICFGADATNYFEVIENEGNTVR